VAAGAEPETGAFRPGGPWRVEPEKLAWTDGIGVLRAATQSGVALRTRRPRVPPLGRLSHALLRLGGALAVWWLRERGGGSSERRSALSRRLRVAFARLGPSYVKLGQIVSSGRGLFPPEIVDEFRLLRDRVPPAPFREVRRVVEAELGRPLEAVFGSFEPECLASASIAQVHAARLASGESVVVKVQRPRIEERVWCDVAALAWAAPWLVGRIPIAALANPPAVVDLFAETISEELDFRLEAQNMLDVAAVLGEAGQGAVWVPRPHPELVTRRVLVMERLDGWRYEDVEAMRAAGVDTHAVVRALLISFLEGAMIYGVFHGDLHGGNLAVLRDGRVALYDYGMTGRMDAAQRLAFLRMMLTAAVGDMRGHLEALRDLGALATDADLDALVRVLHFDRPAPDPLALSSEDLVAEIQSVLKTLLAQGARLPKHLMLYVKGMLFFDGAIAVLAPDLNLFEEVANIYAYFIAAHGERIAAEIGFDPRDYALDLSRARETLGLDADAGTLTHSDLMRRRAELQRRMDATRGEILGGLRGEG
jgi:ubiquinone biosynthesis protein